VQKMNMKVMTPNTLRPIARTPFNAGLLKLILGSRAQGRRVPFFKVDSA
jgi:hypothetical protein